MQYIQFYRESTGYVEYTIPPKFVDPAGQPLIEMCGSDSVYVMPGKSVAHWTAYAIMRKRDALGYAFFEGSTFMDAKRRGRVYDFRSQQYLVDDLASIHLYAAYLMTKGYAVQPENLPTALHDKTIIMRNEVEKRSVVVSAMSMPAWENSMLKVMLNNDICLRKDLTTDMWVAKSAQDLGAREDAGWTRTTVRDGKKMQSRYDAYDAGSAILRCIVANKLGDRITIPKMLKEIV